MTLNVMFEKHNRQNIFIFSLKAVIFINCEHRECQCFVVHRAEILLLVDVRLVTSSSIATDWLWHSSLLQ